MTALYNKSYYNKIKKQRKKLLTVYLILLAVAILSVAGIIVFYAFEPYGTQLETPLKISMYAIICIFTIFSGIFLFISFGRVNKYYNFLTNLFLGKKKTLTVTVITFYYEPKTNDGVDFYTMDVLEWSDAHNDYVKHNVLVDLEFKNLDIKEGDMLQITTSLNALMEYKKI